MIFVSKLLTALILPPGGIIICLLLVALIVPRRYKFVPIMLTVLLYFMSIQPGADLLLRPLEDAYPPLSSQNNKDVPAKDIQAIVVLGGGTVQGSPEAGPEQDTLTADAVKRVVYAYSLRNDFSAVYVFSGGKVFDYGQETEAAAAARLFAALGLPSRRLVLEAESRNTWESAAAVAKLGYKRVVLVTSAYHIRRSVSSFERNGITVIPAPTDYKCERGQKYNFLSFLPAHKNLTASWLALHERTGLLSYLIFYRNPCTQETAE